MEDQVGGQLEDGPVKQAEHIKHAKPKNKLQARKQKGAKGGR